MSLPVAVLENYLAMAELPIAVGNEFITFDGAHAALDAQFVDLMSYVLDHFERIAAMPRQGDLTEALLLETFVDMARGVGFLNGPESPGLRLNTTRRSSALLVARAEDYMRANFHEPLAMPQVARELGVSLRTLQMAFRECRAATLRQYLSAVRLEEARKRLLQSDYRDNVTTAAFDCGIVHLGRFSQAYLMTYGEYPSDTLRRSLRRG